MDEEQRLLTMLIDSSEKHNVNKKEAINHSHTLMAAYLQNENNATNFSSGPSTINIKLTQTTFFT